MSSTPTLPPRAARFISSTPSTTRSIRSPPHTARGNSSIISIAKSPSPSLPVDGPPVTTSYNPFPYHFVSNNSANVSRAHHSASQSASLSTSAGAAAAALVTLQIGSVVLQFDHHNPFIRLCEIHDLLSLIFDFLFLTDIGYFVQVCRFLSFQHYNYHWKRHHIVRWPPFVHCFRYASLLHSSLLNFAGDSKKFSAEFVTLLRTKQPKRRKLFAKKSEVMLGEWTWRKKVWNSQLAALEEFSERVMLRAATSPAPASNGVMQWSPPWLARLGADVDAMHKFRFTAVDEMDNGDLPRHEWSKILSHVEWMKLAPIRWTPTTLSPLASVSSPSFSSAAASLSPTSLPASPSEGSPGPLLRSLLIFSSSSSTLMSLDVGDEFNQPLPVGLLPPSLKSLRIGRGFLQELTAGVLPPSLRQLQLYSSRFKEALVPGSLNDGLEEFDDLRPRYTAEETTEPGVLPASLKRFSAYLIRLANVGVLPEGLEHLRLRGYHGSISADVLPATLKTLQFSDYCGFNDDLDVCLANCIALQSLSLDEDFSQVILPRTLPESLTELKFAAFTRYPHPIIHGMLPPNLRSLTLGRGFVRKAIEPNVLPLSLTELQLPQVSDAAVKIIIGALPPSIRVIGQIAHSPAEMRLWKKPHTLEKICFHPKFDFSCHLTDLPCDSLRELEFGEYFNQPLEFDAQKPPPVFGQLRKLTFSTAFNQDLPPAACFPNLTELLLGTAYNLPLTKERVPPNLQFLKFDITSRFNQPLGVSVFPKSLTYIQFGRAFNQPLAHGMLPSQLKTLHFQGRFNQLLAAGSLPDSVEEITFASYDQALQPGGLPLSLKTLIIQGRFDHPLLHLPAALIHLQLDSSFCTKILPGQLPANLRLLELFSQQHERLLAKEGRPRYLRIKMTVRDGFRLRNPLEIHRDDEEEYEEEHSAHKEGEGTEEKERSEDERSASADTEYNEGYGKAFAANGKRQSTKVNKADCVLM